MGPKERAPRALEISLISPPCIPAPQIQICLKSLSNTPLGAPLGVSLAYRCRFRPDTSVSSGGFIVSLSLGSVPKHNPNLLVVVVVDPRSVSPKIKNFPRKRVRKKVAHWKWRSIDPSSDVATGVLKRGVPNTVTIKVRGENTPVWGRKWRFLGPRWWVSGRAGVGPAGLAWRRWLWSLGFFFIFLSAVLQVELRSITGWMVFEPLSKNFDWWWRMHWDWKLWRNPELVCFGCVYCGLVYGDRSWLCRNGIVNSHNLMLLLSPFLQFLCFPRYGILHSFCIVKPSIGYFFLKFAKHIEPWFNLSKTVAYSHTYPPAKGMKSECIQLIIKFISIVIFYNSCSLSCFGWMVVYHLFAHCLVVYLVFLDPLVLNLGLTNRVVVGFGLSHPFPRKGSKQIEDIGLDVVSCPSVAVVNQRHITAFFSPVSYVCWLFRWRASVMLLKPRFHLKLHLESTFNIKISVSCFLLYVMKYLWSDKLGLVGSDIQPFNSAKTVTSSHTHIPLKGLKTVLMQPAGIAQPAGVPQPVVHCLLLYNYIFLHNRVCFSLCWIRLFDLGLRYRRKNAGLFLIGGFATALVINCKLLSSRMSSAKEKGKKRWW